LDYPALAGEDGLRNGEVESMDGSREVDARGTTRVEPTPSQTAAAARIRIAADEKNFAVTPRWIRKLANPR